MRWFSHQCNVGLVEEMAYVCVKQIKKQPTKQNVETQLQKLDILCLLF